MPSAGRKSFDMDRADQTISERCHADRACRFRRISGSGFRLALEVTARCNLTCRHCFVQPNQSQPSTDEITGILRQAKQLGCRKLILTGGEPLLRPDLEQIIASAAALGILCDLNSNVYALTRERACALRTAGLQEASVSLYGADALHDALTGQKGSFERVLQGIDLFREVGITVDVHGAIWNEMLPDLNDLIDTVQTHGVSSISFFSLIPTGTRNGTDAYVLSPDLALKTIAQAREIFSLPIRTVGLRPLEKEDCVMGNGIYGIGADLHLRPCLLSRNKENTGIDLHTHNLREGFALLSQQIARGTWCTACYPPAEGNSMEGKVSHDV
jgi:MoaA/NifB/PqqE/SkfB family radical SAM enzyme